MANEKRLARIHNEQKLLNEMHKLPDEISIPQEEIEESEDGEENASESEYVPGMLSVHVRVLFRQDAMKFVHLPRPLYFQKFLPRLDIL